MRSGAVDNIITCIGSSDCTEQRQYENPHCHSQDDPQALHHGPTIYAKYIIFACSGVENGF